jgi:raffinose/stachyose/melibiose transport system substrate-binding protein
MAKKFIIDLVDTPAGHSYMVEAAGMIPAYSGISLQPTGQLSKSVQEWSAAGKVYSWSQYYFTGDFRDKTLSPIYNQFASGNINKAQFIDQMTKALIANKQ